MLFSFDELKASFTNYKGIEQGEGVWSVSTDSREKKPNSLFIPIVGERFNGHDFLEDAIAQGAVATLWDRRYKVPVELQEKCLFFYVDDTLTALHRLAKDYRNRVNPIVIGITGSNGKTTTKDFVASALKATYRTHKTAGNFNNEIGLPLTILSMPRDTEVLVLEMGMSNFGEINRLSQIARPDYAIITNIGESHIEFLGSRDGIAKAKLEIVNGMGPEGRLLIDGDEELLRSHSFPQDIIALSFQKEGQGIRKISNAQVSLEETRFVYGERSYTIPLTGAHHAKNAAYAIEVARLLRVDEEEIRQGLKDSETTGMRFEQLRSPSGAVIINDAYNASVTSMIGAIQIIKQIEGFDRRILVLGDVLELGKYSKDFHRQIGKAIDTPIDYLFTYGEQARQILEGLSKASSIHSEHFTNRDALVERLAPLMEEGTIALFKASRGMAFETLIEALVTE